MKRINRSFAATNQILRSEEAERQRCNGTIEFYVSQNAPGVFEIEVLDHHCCSGSREEIIGIEYYITQVWCLQDRVREGVTYELQNVTVEWTSGEWGFTEDDVEYEFLNIVTKFNALTYLSVSAAYTPPSNLRCSLRVPRPWI